MYGEYREGSAAVLPLPLTFANNVCQIDFDRLAALCGYKNANTARTMISYKRRQMRPADTEKMPTVKGVPQGGRLPAIKKESVYVEPLPVVKKESMDPQMLVRNMDGGEVKKKRIKREDDFVGGAPAKKRRE